MAEQGFITKTPSPDISIRDFIAWVDSHPNKELPGKIGSKKILKELEMMLVTPDEYSSLTSTYEGEAKRIRKDPLVQEAHAATNNLTLDSPMSDLNTKEGNKFIREAFKVKTNIRRLSEYSPTELRAVFGDKIPSPDSPKMLERHIPLNWDEATRISGLEDVPPSHLNSHYVKLRTFIDVWIEQGHSIQDQPNNVVKYLEDSKGGLTEFENWGSAFQKSRKKTGLLGGVKFKDYVKALQNAIEFVPDEVTDADTEKLEELKEAFKTSYAEYFGKDRKIPGIENMTASDIRTAKNVMKLKLGLVGARNKDLFDIGIGGTEGVTLDINSNKITGASGKTGGTQAIPLGNLSSMAAQEQLAERRYQVITDIAKNNNISIDDATKIFKDSLVDEEISKLKLINPKKAALIEHLTSLFLTYSAQTFDSGRVDAAGEKILGLGIISYDPKTNKKRERNVLRLADMRDTAVSVIMEDESLGSVAERERLAEEFLGHKTAKTVAKRSYIQKFADSSMAQDFKRGILKFENFWTEITGRGDVFNWLKGSSTKNIPSVIPDELGYDLERDFERSNFSILDADANIQPVSDTAPLEQPLAAYEDTVKYATPFDGRPKEKEVTFEPEEVRESRKTFTEALDDLKEKAIKSDHPLKNMSEAQRDGYVDRLVRVFDGKKGPPVAEGVELLEGVFEEGDDVVRHGASRTLVKPFESGDLVKSVLRRVGDDIYLKEWDGILSNTINPDTGTYFKEPLTPIKTRRPTPKQQAKIDAKTSQELDKMRRRAVEILEENNFDTKDLRFSKIIYELASKIDPQFDEDFKTFTQQNALTNDILTSHHEKFVNTWLDETAQKKTLKNLARFAGRVGKVLYGVGKKTPWKPMLYGLVPFALIDPVSRLFEAERELGAKAEDLSISELTYDIPEAEEKRDIALRDIASEATLVSRMKAPVPLTPLDIQMGAELIGGNPAEAEAFNKKIVASDETGTLGDMQKALSTLDIKRKDPRLTAAAIVSQTPEGHSRRSMVKDQYDNLKKVHDQRFARHAIKVKALEDANRYELDPFITKEQRAARNEMGVGDDTLYEIDTFEEFNEDNNAASLVANESFLN